ncbi:hypothetical protein AB4865_05815 [Capnocytophaga sp. ARDL2]|uniref:hypothetical protein n=1 Tax=Capnocytophaga sp. ARDL2 TaxID=3238809 RepID=UPI003557ACAD
MIEKNVWTETDFIDMSWHDSLIHSISFPDNNFEFKIELEYIFKWDLNKQNVYDLWISPCTLIFNDVSNLEISIDYKDSMSLYISEIIMKNKRKSVNGKVFLYDYEILLDKGVIKFSASGFKQIVKQQPMLLR